MNRSISSKIALILILLLAAILRFWNLGNVPPSASMDEASIGYNAYSVLKTGKDEFGEFPLISQRGYDDWRRSTYLFLTVPFIKLFGLNAISVRLPAVILSILTVWATYYIVKLLFSKPSVFSESTALLSSFLLAISPWHVYISRLGHESNACLSFLIFGILFFLKGQKSATKLFLSIIFFTLSMVSYYSGQAFIPLFVLGSLFIFRKNLVAIIKENKKILITFFIFTVLLIPIFWSIFSPQALIRFQGTSTFKPDEHLELFSQRVLAWNKAVEKHDIFGMIFYNRHLFPLQVLIQGYISHFNPKWLFTNSSSEPFKAPNMGLLYLWELPLIIIGIIAFLLTGFFNGKIKKFIFLWFLLAPIPGAIATQAPHAMRSYNFLPTWQIFASFGFLYTLYKFKNLKGLILSIFALLTLFGWGNFYKNYFILFPKEQSKSFHYALSKTIPYVKAHENKYSKIIFSNKDNLYQSYMLFLFHSRYDPSRYQKLGGTKSGGFAETHVFDKYEFRPIVWGKDKYLKNTLFVGSVNEFESLVPYLASFTNLDGKGEIKVVEN